MENRSVVSCYGNKVIVTVDLEDNKLKSYIHDKMGWIFDTTNVVVALNILGDKKLSDLDTNKDNTKLLDIIDNKLPYNKELVLNSLNDDGDLNWIHWLSGGDAYWCNGYDTDYIYDDIKDMYLEHMDEEDEDENGYTDAFYNKVDKIYNNVMEKYNSDKILEEVKKDNEEELLSIINSSSTWTELFNDIDALSLRIISYRYEYLTDFIYECNVL